jgi:His/Glu/Gln/Arg/opine family amino acid ABC transporter permease subunit
MRARDRVVRWALYVVAAVGAVGVVLALGQVGVYSGPYTLGILDELFEGFLGTAFLVSLVIPIGFGVGFLVGWARTARSWLPRAAGTAYVEFFRGMPPLVLIVFGSLGAALVFRRYFYVEDPFLASLVVGVFALAFHSAGYQAEIIRAGIQSVPRGQVEAAYALGLTPWQTLTAVIMPQAFRVSLPALGNEFSSVIKDTSLLSAISAFELSYVAALLARGALNVNVSLVALVWIEAAVLYFVLTFAVIRVVKVVENRVKVPGLEAART